ncbi:MAG: hypothetical protein F6K56_09765, partial [Moorea sp. SIO3G5]|nr:hypothetical protein [Moorena sp. SIO3G5]
FNLQPSTSSLSTFNLQPATFNQLTLAKRPRDRVQPANLQPSTFNQLTLAKRPRDRVQPSTALLIPTHDGMRPRSRYANG